MYEGMTLWYRKPDNSISHDNALTYKDCVIYFSYRHGNNGVMKIEKQLELDYERPTPLIELEVIILGIDKLVEAIKLKA